MRVGMNGQRRVRMRARRRVGRMWGGGYERGLGRLRMRVYSKGG